MIVRPARAWERNRITCKRWLILDHTNRVRARALTRRGALRILRRWRRMDERARAETTVA